MGFVIGFCRYALPLLTFVILFKCFQTLLIGHPVNKTYGYIVDKTTKEKIPLNTWETSIGRSKSCDIVLPYGDVSRFHAVICRRVDGWYLFDTISKIGTFVNGEKIEKGATIKHTDEISFAGNSFVFVITDDPVIQVGKKKKRFGKKKIQVQHNPDVTEDEILSDEEAVSFSVDENAFADVYAPEDDMSSMYINFHPSGKNEIFTDFGGDDIYSDTGAKADVFTSADIPDSRPTSSGDTGAYPEEKSKISADAQGALYNPSGAETFLLCSNHITLGRSRASDIRINSPDASRNHAVLTRSGGKWYISDANSTHGVYVNGEKITEMTPLFDGDIIGIGSVEMRFIADYR